MGLRYNRDTVLKAPKVCFINFSVSVRTLTVLAAKV